MQLQYGLILCLLPVFIHAQLHGSACVSPSGHRGACTRLRECDQLYNLLVNSKRQGRNSGAISFLQRSQCGFDGGLPVVCCPGRNPKELPGPKPTVVVVTEPYVKVDTPATPAPMIHRTTERPKITTITISASISPLTALLPQQCGSGEEPRDSIHGGVNATLGEFPWLAGLEYVTWRGRFVACGGALISDRYVITAAHCIRSNQNERLDVVRLGDHDTETDPDCIPTLTGPICADKVLKIKVERAIRHPGYLDSTKHNDIGFLRLAQKVDFTGFIKPICLPNGAMLRNDYTGSKQTVAGWGRTESSWRSTSKLKVNLPILSNEACQRLYPTVALNQTQMCAGGEGGKDSCSGDSGGPIMMYNGRWFVTGLVSIGPQVCGTANEPGVYTRVAPYVSWILDNIQP